MTKRITCLFLALLTVLSLAIPALGDEAPAEPVASAAAPETPEPSLEPEPTEPPQTTPEPEPTELPEATPEPGPSELPEATPEQEPTEPPETTPEPEPSELPEVTPEPEPAPPAAEPIAEKAVKLPAPVIQSVSGTADGARIAWSPVTGAAQYRVYYKSASGWQRIAVTSATILTWVGAKSGTKYTFTVRAFDRAGRGGYYDKTGKTLSYIAAPAINKVSCAASGVKISWGKVSGAARYRVFYKSPSGWKRIGDTAGTSFTWTGAKSGTKYTFTVRCLSADKKSYTSAYKAAGKTLTYIAAPAISKVSCAASGVKISWGKVPGAARYRVFYKSPSGWKRIGDTAGTSFTWTGAKSGTKYTFTVRCLSADKKSYTSAYNAAGKTLTYIAAPAITAADSTARGLELRWAAVTGAARYRVFVKTAEGWERLGDTAGTSFTWTGAQQGVGYIFTVRCLSADGKRYTSAYDAAGAAAVYAYQAARPLENLEKVSGLNQESRGCCMATSFSMAANLILGRDEYGAFDWTAPNSDALNVSTYTTLAGSDGHTYRPYWKDAGSADGLRTVIDAALADGCPIIASVQKLSTAGTHYVVVVGWADEAHSDYLIADPAVAGGPMTSCAVPMAGNRGYSLGNKNGTFVYLGFTRS